MFFDGCAAETRSSEHPAPLSSYEGRSQCNYSNNHYRSVTFKLVCANWAETLTQILAELLSS